jgi:hypothetical protein
MLESIHLGGHCSGFESGLSEIDTQRNSIHGEMVHISTVFLSDLKPDVDYGKLVARMPQLTAQNDSLDEMLFKMASAVFLCLVDDTRKDAAGTLDHLILTGGAAHSDEPPHHEYFRSGPRWKRPEVVGLGRLGDPSGACHKKVQGCRRP